MTCCYVVVHLERGSSILRDVQLCDFALDPLRTEMLGHEGIESWTPREILKLLVYVGVFGNTLDAVVAVERVTCPICRVRLAVLLANSPAWPPRVVSFEKALKMLAAG